VIPRSRCKLGLPAARTSQISTVRRSRAAARGRSLGRQTQVAERRQKNSLSPIRATPASRGRVRLSPFQGETGAWSNVHRASVGLTTQATTCRRCAAQSEEAQTEWKPRAMQSSPADDAGTVADFPVIEGLPDTWVHGSKGCSGRTCPPSSGRITFRSRSGARSRFVFSLGTSLKPRARAS